MNILYLLILAQSAYNVGLFSGNQISWQTNVQATELTCIPTPTFQPADTSPRVQEFTVGWASDTKPTDYCFVSLKPDVYGQFDVKVRSVTQTSSGTVYSSWTTAIPQLTIQKDPIIDCSVSGWSDWSEWSAWKPYATGEERTRQQTRFVVVPASGGGKPCPTLYNIERETRNVADPATASFVKTDGLTQGTWIGTYGKQGYWFVGVPPKPLGTLNTNGTQFIWASSTVDKRALQKDEKDRIASTWYSPTSFILDLKLPDAQQHQVALYLVDFDNRNRQVVVDVLDSMETTLNVPTQKITSYPSGLYLIYLVSGHVKFRILNPAPSAETNATTAGVFVDAPSVVPINCVVSDWTVGIWGPWAPINSTTEERSRTDTRTILTPSSGGGTACPSLTEVVKESRPIASLSILDTMKTTQCLVRLSAPPPPNTAPGWTANWYVDSGLFSQDPTTPYEGLIQVSVGTHSFQVRWTKPAGFIRRMMRSAEAAVVYDPVTFVCQ